MRRRASRLEKLSCGVFRTIAFHGLLGKQKALDTAAWICPGPRTGSLISWTWYWLPRVLHGGAIIAVPCDNRSLTTGTQFCRPCCCVRIPCRTLRLSAVLKESGRQLEARLKRWVLIRRGLSKSRFLRAHLEAKSTSDIARNSRERTFRALPAGFRRQGCNGHRSWPI